MALARRLASFAMLVLLAAGPAHAQGAAHLPSAERPILLIAQLNSGALPGDAAEQLRPLKTMAEVEAFLASKGIPFSRGRLQLDSRQADAKLLEAIRSLPPGEIFVIPLKDGFAFNQVLRTLTPDAARDVENW